MRKPANRTILCVAISILVYIFASEPALNWLKEHWDFELIRIIWDISAEYLFGNIPMMVFLGVIMVYMEVKILGFSEEEDSGAALLWQLPFAVLIGIFGGFSAIVLCGIRIFVFLFG